VGIAFVGAGMVSELHGAAVGRSDAARLVGVFDIDADLAARRAVEWSCRTFASFEALLADDEVEAVFILSPTSLHVEHAEAALRAGKHVLVEKPVSRDAAAVTRLARLASRKGLVCIPGHNYAYIPEYQRIKRLIRDGRLGRVRLGAVTFAIAHTEEVARHYDGVMWLVMPHHAYLMYGLLGMPASVTAGVTEPAWQSLDRDDQSWMVLDYPPYGTALLFTTLGADDDSAEPWTLLIKVIGTSGSASASWRAAVVHGQASGSMSIGWAPYEEAYERELAAFVAAVRGDPSGIASPLEEAAAVARIISAAEASARRGRTVKLPATRGEGVS
jgi:predicted dehydrogenase